MKIGNHKFSFKHFLGTPIAFFLSLIVLGIIAYSFVAVIPKQKRSQEAKKEAQEELGSLQEQKGSLEEEIGLLTSNFGQEKALREKFGVVKEGEEIVVLVDEENGIEYKDDTNIFIKIFGILGKIFIGG